MAKCRVSKNHPELMKSLARMVLLVRLLEKEINANKLAPQLGIRKQSFEVTYIQKALKQLIQELTEKGGK
jgi:hypothetical protein